MRLNLEGLEETKIYYKQKLKDEELTGGERDSYLKALRLIEGFIERELAKKSGKRERIINLLPKIRWGGDHKEMGKLVSGLYKLARVANDISKLASGDPKKITRRIKNKIIGKKLIRKIW